MDTSLPSFIMNFWTQTTQLWTIPSTLRDESLCSNRPFCGVVPLRCEVDWTVAPFEIGPPIFFGCTTTSRQTKKHRNKLLLQLQLTIIIPTLRCHWFTPVQIVRWNFSITFLSIIHCGEKQTTRLSYHIITVTLSSMGYIALVFNINSLTWKQSEQRK